MIKNQKIINYDCFNSSHYKAYRKICSFDYFKDETIKLLYKDLELDCSTIGSVKTLIMDGEFCVSVSDRDSYYIITPYDVLVREPYTMEANKELSKIWRKIMFTKYGDTYKNRLIEVVNKRKSEAVKDFNKQINEISGL